MSEMPLERLNYFNGQRLEAGDLKLEQDYHIRVRRWLNKSLYAPGIARGLEVSEVANEPAVVVSPGLALDADGREIILLEAQQVAVTDDALQSAGLNAEVDGLYLTIRYDEERVADQAGCCTSVAATPTSMNSRPPTGRPSRVLAAPLFALRAFLPSSSSGEIVLAQVQLDETCNVKIDLSDRHYVGAASATTVRQYALEGEREVAFIPKECLPAGTPEPSDVNVVGRFYFHVRGRQPNSVTLYIRSEEFSELHYTELGRHDHGLDVTEASTNSIDYPGNPNDYEHSHSLENVMTKHSAAESDQHCGEHDNHTMLVPFSLTGLAPDSDSYGSIRLETEGMTFPYGSFFFTQDFPNPLTGEGGWGVQAGFSPLNRAGCFTDRDMLQYLSQQNTKTPNTPKYTAKISGGRHEHLLDLQAETGKREVKPYHTHTFTPQVGLSGAGADVAARSGASLSYVKGLDIYIGHPDVGPDADPHTSDILQQLADADPTVWRGKTRLGDGGDGGDVLKNRGTGAIRLDFLPGVAFLEGEHCIEFRVPELQGDDKKPIPNGGRIRYNLYVE
jgi:hypothetical protein